MNDQGVDADHVAAPESGDTCTTPLRTEAAVERVPADQKPPSGGSVDAHALPGTRKMGYLDEDI